jgi:hypothetical protein
MTIQMAQGPGRDGQPAWRVFVDGRATVPLFPTKAAAEAYVEGIRRGHRVLEFRVAGHDVPTPHWDRS